MTTRSILWADEPLDSDDESVPRSDDQVAFHDAQIQAMMPKIYGAEWRTESKRVMDAHPGPCARSPILVFADPHPRSECKDPQFKDVKFTVKQVVEFVNEKRIRRWRAYIPASAEVLFDSGRRYPATEAFIALAEKQTPAHEWRKYGGGARGGQ